MKKKKLHLKEEEEYKFLNKKIKKINNKNNIIDSNPKKIHFLKIITEISKSECNFNTLCAFNSVDDILYLIYSEKNNNSIICYNLIDNKRINIIKNANKDPIISLRHFLDKNQNRDLLISISLIISENGFKLWNINNFECIYNFNNIYDNYSELSVCVLNDNNENYIITGIAITGTFSKAYEKNIKIFNFNGNKIKEICNISDIFYIDNYYDKKLCKNFIITGNNKYIKSFDFVNSKEFLTYYDDENLCYNYYYGVCVNNKDEITQIIASSNQSLIIVWNFHTGKMIQKIKASSYGFYAICLWNKDYLWAGWEDKSIKLIDLNNFKFVKTLNSHKNNIVTIKKIQHEKYGNFIISQDDDVGRKGKATIKLWGNKYKYT